MRVGALGGSDGIHSDEEDDTNDWDPEEEDDEEENDDKDDEDPEECLVLPRSFPFLLLPLRLSSCPVICVPSSESDVIE